MQYVSASYFLSPKHISGSTNEPGQSRFRVGAVAAATAGSGFAMGCLAGPASRCRHAGCGGTTRPSQQGPRPRVGPSSGATGPACAPMRCAVAAMRPGLDARGAGIPQAGRPRPHLGLADRGELRWMVLDGAVKALRLLRVLPRLVRDADGRVCASSTACRSTGPPRPVPGRGVRPGSRYSTCLGTALG
jgi:hypothetical protein